MNCDADDFFSPKFEASDTFKEHTCKKKKRKKNKEREPKKEKGKGYKKKLNEKSSELQGIL